MKKIEMKTPLVEMNGDEMTRVLWDDIKKILLIPFVDLKTEYFDLSLPERNRTQDAVTHEAAQAIIRYGVGVKCATITPNAQRMEEYGLDKLWPSPNATIRAALDGTVFREPILVSNIQPVVSTWKKPITVARHAYGDVYKGTELLVSGAGLAELLFTGKDGTVVRQRVYEFEGPGILQAQHNRDDSILSFARSCFGYALQKKQDLWFATKDTISKTYDHRFKDLFGEVYEREFKQLFETEGISYFYTLIDDAVARMIRSPGGFVLACKNYDGDVLSDLVSTAFGSLAMMTSVLVSPDGKYEYEAAHGTVTRHYYRYRKGEETSTNPMALLFAWTGALRKRGELDSISGLMRFADRLEAAAVAEIESGTMTKDLAALCELENVRPVSSLGFLEAVRDRFVRETETA